MKLKVLTLNLWRYYDWKKRKRNVIKFLKEQNADIVFLQEIAYDEKFKDKWLNQLEEINKELVYKYSAFGKLSEMNKWHGKPINRIMYYGLGFLSKSCIKSSEVVILPHIEKKKNFGFMHIVIKTSKGDIDLINVHFENTDEGSKGHLAKTLQWCNKKRIKPIIAGDFNMKIVDNLIELSEGKYSISYVLKNYKSFIPTKFSHDKIPITLDYILAHKGKFKMREIECANTKISDHNPVISILEF